MFLSLNKKINKIKKADKIKLSLNVVVNIKAEITIIYSCLINLSL